MSWPNTTISPWIFIVRKNLIRASETDYTIIGAGIIGLTLAYAILERWPKATISIFEKEPDIGFHASGRNSGVVHSGIYYPPGTQKAILSVEGALLLKDFAKDYDIPYRQAGKLIVSTSSSLESSLYTLMQNAEGNGISATLCSRVEIQGIEPYAESSFGGIYSPETGVIDSLGVLRTLKNILVQKGIRFFFEEPVRVVDAEGSIIETSSYSQKFQFLFNCAGAYSDHIAKMFGFAKDHVLIPFKGIYFELDKKRDYLIRESIYPVPDLAFPFLGVHLTRNVHGKIYVGPTAIPAFGRENYQGTQGVNIQELIEILPEMGELFFLNKDFRKLAVHEIQKYSKRNFFKMARNLVPELRPDDLLSSQKVGIRPQLANIKKKALETDFIFERGPTSYHVLNSISPAFTSSFAVGKMIVDRL